MRPHDLSAKPSVDNPLSDLAMSASSPIQQNPGESKNTANSNHSNSNLSKRNNDCSNNNFVVRRERPARECTKRAAARLQAQAAAEAEAQAAARQRKKKTSARKERLAARLLREEEDEEEYEDEKMNGSEEEKGEEEEDGLSKSSKQQCSKIVTPLVAEPEASQLPRWKLRSMWQLASILNFLNIFRPLLNIKVEFSVEEFETALIMPNSTLADIHMPLLKAIPPVTRVALGYNTWVTVLCRKLRDWWHWVAEGDLPIVASHGAEIDAYSVLDPAVRVVILKALCDIRVEQEDIRNYIDNSLKQGVQLSAFRKERIGGDSHGISYWYEDDPIIGHRLYREIRKVEVKKGKGKNVQPIPNSCYQWETAATNLDEFQDVSEKLFASNNRTEVSVGKKLKNNMLHEIEKVHKRKEKLLKKQHRQALLLDSMMNIDGFTAGRSLRGRKPVTYSFDDYDRSINEAIKVTTKKQPSPEHSVRRDASVKREAPANGILRGPQFPHVSFKLRSPKSPEYDEYDDDYDKAEPLDRGNRRRQRPQRYSEKEFVEAVSDNEAEFNSDDDIVGEVVYDDEYLRRRKQLRMASSSSEGDEEYKWDEENPEEEEEEEEDDDGDDSFSASEDSGEHRRLKRLRVGRTRRESKLRSAGEFQSGLRRSRRATRNSIDYKQYELSESETEPMKPEKSNSSDDYDYNNVEFSNGSTESVENSDNQDVEANQSVNVATGTTSEQANAPDYRQYELSESEMEPVKPEKSNSSDEYYNGLDYNNAEFSAGSTESEENNDNQDGKANQSVNVATGTTSEQANAPEISNSTDQEEVEGGGRKRRFLDLNELAPGSGFDDGPSSEMKDNSADGF
nr:DDT domain-containing protein DDR4 [Ipomoea batatas]